MVLQSLPVLGALLGVATTAGAITLQNDRASFTFDVTGGAISLVNVSSGGGGAATATAPFSALWQLQLLTPAGFRLCSPDATVHASATLNPAATAATLTWLASCDGGGGNDPNFGPIPPKSAPPAVFEVTQVWTLAAGEPTASIGVTVRPCAPSSTAECVATSAPQQVGLWAVTVSVGGAPLGEAFYPSGYGTTHARGYGTVGSSVWAYPSSQATMQFMATSGLYFAAHDSAAHHKYLTVHEHTAVTQAPADAENRTVSSTQKLEDVSQATSSPESLREGTTPDCNNPLAPNGFPLGVNTGVPAKTQSMTVTTLLEGAGAPLSAAGYTLPFELAVGPLGGPGPMWYQAAEIYRSWALVNAEWTRLGPVADRPTHFPKWFLDLNVWVNSGWQCYDRFNDTQGDPPTVLENARAINQRFNLSSGIGLHWYEWQCGFPDLCTENHGAHRFKFDTMYPDYDPPRRGAEFGEVVAALQREKVYTFPYINGRIFDNNSASFKTEDGVSRVVKQALAPRFGAVGPLLECKESYGSEELDGDLVYFDVADPSTSYWQDKYAGQVSRLVNLSGVSGVYIDQLAAGAPLADWTPRPEHGVGGGAWWRKGLMRLLNQAHTVSMVDGAWSPLVVESNAEFLMDAANGLLTLAAFDAPFAPPDIPTPGASVFSPAFPAVYGGYFVGFGSIFTHNDLALNPDVFASRLAASFVWGIQLGWFSLGGVDHGPDLDTRCGPMYTLQSFLDPQHDPEVEFLRLLAQSRGLMSRYFVHGRLAQPVEISPTPKTFHAPPQKLMPRNKGPFPELSSAVWATTHNTTSTTICVYLVTPRSNSVSATFDLRLSDYGMEGDNFVVVQVSPDGNEKRVATVQNGAVRLTRAVPGRSVEMLEVRPTAVP